MREFPYEQGNSRTDVYIFVPELGFAEKKTKKSLIFDDHKKVLRLQLTVLLQ